MLPMRLNRQRRLFRALQGYARDRRCSRRTFEESLTRTFKLAVRSSRSFRRSRPAASLLFACLSTLAVVRAFQPVCPSNSVTTVQMFHLLDDYRETTFSVS
jgi:hypothetical protein